MKLIARLRFVPWLRMNGAVLLYTFMEYTGTSLPFYLYNVFFTLYSKLIGKMYQRSIQCIHHNCKPTYCFFTIYLAGRLTHFFLIQCYILINFHYMFRCLYSTIIRCPYWIKKLQNYIIKYLVTFPY